MLVSQAYIITRRSVLPGGGGGVDDNPLKISHFFYIFNPCGLAGKV